MADRQHLQRLDRVWIDHPIYFVTTCVCRRRPILAAAETTAILRREWEAARERYGWLVGRYVVMPDHVHFFCAECATGAKHALSRFVGSWKEWTAKELSRVVSLPAPVWQERFFDHVLRSDESYAEKWAYVRENPVRAGLASTWAAWPYQGFVDFDFPNEGFLL